MLQTPVPYSIEPLQKKKKPRHKSCELYMSLASSSTRKVFDTKKLFKKLQLKLCKYFETNIKEKKTNY